jgi:cytochrome c oxidase assembly protein subunit 15
VPGPRGRPGAGGGGGGLAPDASLSARMLRRLPLLNPRQYQCVAEVALAALTLIVFTGAAVRLSGSGLGCPDWPKCYGGVAPPLKTHAIIEYGNRILSGLVGLAAVAAGVLAWRRRPFRRDLALIGVLLPLGVVGQAVLGGFTVRNHLAPGFVMGHFALSMLILIAAVTLAWRARHDRGERPRSTDRLAVWSVRGLLPLGALTIFAGTAATAAGPHAGGAGTGDVIDRLEWRGAGTLDWAIHQHARIASVLGVAAIAVWFLLRRRDADPDVRRAMTVACVLLAAQGAVGAIQYQLELPAEVVWIHVALAACLWLSLLWATAAAGRLAPAPKRATARAAGPPLVRS